ncbi:2TM domain-containing protein [Kaistella sp.]|uniref:2TM domain-containing protein n=1 Tax=Kaistella sp. TaxID=2782235 RepID=UPI0035A07E2A
MENLTKTEVDYAMAKERVNQIRKFYVSLAVFIIVFAIYSGRKYYKAGEVNYLDFNNVSVIFWIWGLILAIRAVKIFFFNHDWERKMMDRELNK